MIFVAERNYWYIPPINGNENLPQDEQLQIEIIRPTVEKQGRLSTTEVVRNEDGSVKLSTAFNTKEILNNFVGEIKNLSTEQKLPDGSIKEVVIKTGKELANAVFYGSKVLADLICAEVATDKITDEQKKILK
jgi:hypothetical protein